MDGNNFSEQELKSTKLIQDFWMEAVEDIRRRREGGATCPPGSEYAINDEALHPALVVVERRGSGVDCRGLKTGGPASSPDAAGLMRRSWIGWSVRLVRRAWVHFRGLLVAA